MDDENDEHMYDTHFILFWITLHLVHQRCRLTISTATPRVAPYPVKGADPSASGIGNTSKAQVDEAFGHLYAKKP